MKSRKRYLIFAGLVALLVLTGVLNYYFNNSNSQLASTSPDTSQSLDTETSTTTTSNFFASFRAERESSRTQEIAYLDAIINNEATDTDTLKEAQQQKIEISKAMEKEVTIEGLVKAKGFNDVVVTIQSGSVNVVVDSETLEDAQVAQILDIVKTESGVSSENIKVIPKS
jgi:stage III sporulation protein AH